MSKTNHHLYHVVSSYHQSLNSHDIILKQLLMQQHLPCLLQLYTYQSKKVGQNEEKEGQQEI